MSDLDLRLVGAGGEPVDLRRTISSHGLASLPPLEPLDEDRALRMTVPLKGGKARTLEVRQAGARIARMHIPGRAPGATTRAELIARVRHILALDRDLSRFYEQAARDPSLGWVTGGAGRMIRSATVFEDVVKTICTTNCAWSATVRMVRALVEHLGPRAPGAPATGWHGRAFPAPAAMATAGEDFYRDVVRAGYRGPYLISLASSVASGDIDLEAWGEATPAELSDDELGDRLRSLPGVGPYAAAHIMMMLGRNSRLILDSWTRPTYARLVGRRTVKDSTIERRFKPYGEQAGLAFWLFLTRDWVPEPVQARS
ncbi:MAG TPA: Fe-S cluster assembly protein HesB [Actinomycetota bacterium]|nr:Fe-S cluster assembly protein HesB [Actinomycetota bacterium]